MIRLKRTPLTVTGGLIVAGIGLGLVAGGLMGASGLSYGFGAGAALGFGAAALARPRVRAKFGSPTRFQKRAMDVAIGAELLAFLALGLFAHSWGFDRLLVAVLFVVSAHFLIMSLSHGPAMLVLGGVGLAWLATASLVLDAPIAETVIGDGLIKMLMGGYIASPLFFMARDGEAPPKTG